jgi:hypothetical protein
VISDVADRAAADQPGERDDLERRLADAPAIAEPTIAVQGDANGAPPWTAARTPANFRVNTRIG